MVGKELDNHYNAALREKIILKLREGKSPETIAEALDIPVAFIKRMECGDVSKRIRDNTEILLTYIPDSIDIISDTMKTYWLPDATPAERKQAVDIAVKLLQNVGMMSSDAPAYQVNNFIQNNISADIKVIAAEWKNRLDEMKTMVASLYGGPANDLGNCQLITTRSDSNAD